MKVFCINTNGWIEDYKFLWLWTRQRDVNPGPEYGDILTVVSEYYNEGILYYNLLEWPPCDGSSGWQSDCFIPLSNIDERELVNEESIINKPTEVING